MSLHLIANRFPDADVLLALEPEELAMQLLFIIKEGFPDGRFCLGTILGRGFGNLPASYTSNLGLPTQVDQAVTEAWHWLEVEGLLIPEAGINGQNGFRRLSRKAQAINNPSDMLAFRNASLLHKSALPERIREVVWSEFIRGYYDAAVFQAVKGIETAVRDATGSHELGVTLMREAFNPTTGRLTDMHAQGGERQALMDLYAGAIGSYKNPQSHRDVNLNDPIEALGIILLAAQLIKLVESRSARSTASS